jgi:glutathionyl-hydroquinone reductase
MAQAQAQFSRETGSDGSWKRQSSAFRDLVTADGSSGLPAQAGRYHLYVSRACPWAHRTIIMRRLKGLEDAIGMTVVDPVRDERGWRFIHGEAPDDPANGERDPVNGWAYLEEGYVATDPGWNGRVTVPTLWDTETGRVVNNESSDVMRMLNSEFDELARRPELDYYPRELREEIDSINEWVYATVNNGVYRCGFATTQTAYDDAFDALFASLDRIDAMLAERRYLAGDRITEADWRLFTTLVRFDAVYVGHFKCNLRRLVDYPNLWPYARELYQHDGIAETVDFDHARRHYYLTHDKLNPTGIIPGGPAVDWNEAHGRG